MNFGLDTKKQGFKKFEIGKMDNAIDKADVQWP